MVVVVALLGSFRGRLVKHPSSTARMGLLEASCRSSCCRDRSC